jgi:hypothetical protein
MRVRLLVVAVLVMLAGCAHAMLPYQPDVQPRGARISAAYQVVGEELRIEIDTDHRRLEQAWIMKPDGTSLAPQAIQSAPVVTGPPPSVGVGVGGGTYAGRGVGVGSGLSIGIPVGSGSSRIEGTTVASFPLAAAGPAPWRVYIKLAGIDPATIVIGGPLPPR